MSEVLTAAIARQVRDHKSVTTLESRVLVSAPRLRDLGAGTETVDIEPIAPLDQVPRALQAPELALPGSSSEC